MPLPWLASAATVTVTNCGDSGAPGQLRTLINNNNARAGGDVIEVPACTITLTMASPLIVTKDVTVAGAGAQETIVDGGGITKVWVVSAGTVALSRMTIRNGSNPGGAGGGVEVDGGSLTLRRAIVRDNHAIAAVGIFVNGGTLKVFDSLIAANTAVPGFGDAGGIAITGTNSSGTITNTTISGNSATANGGGITVAFSASATLTLINSTVANNSADNAGGGIARDGVTGPITLLNTIVAGNVAPSGANCSGPFTSRGHNLESANTCGLDPVLDLSNTDPMLGPLQLNGGPTPTHALLPGSPAVDAGSNLGCPADDQRGVPRPLETTLGFRICDIGAFEFEALGFIQVGLALNTATVHPGTPLQGTVSVTNVGGARPVDAYVVFVPPAAAGPSFGCPGGDALIV